MLPVSAALRMDTQLQSILHPTEEEYARIKANTLKTVRMRENPLVRWSPFEVMKRSTMKKLRNCGYYDIFIPQMKRLSPDYRAYHDALDSLNKRLCDVLGLY